MSIFGKRRKEPDEADPIAYACAHVTSPGAHALLDEVERGRARREARDSAPAADEDRLHAWDLTANDLQLLWIAQGSKGGGGMTLPSGITIRGAATWERLLREAAGMDR